MNFGFGLSEEIIGRWLSEGADRRHRIILATKGYQPARRKVIYVGSSNFVGWDIATAHQIAASRDLSGLV